VDALRVRIRILLGQSRHHRGRVRPVLPFLPGDTLLVAIGLFLATDKFSIVPGPGLLDLAVCCLLLVAAALFGNVLGFEIGNKMGPVIYWWRERGSDRG
jgi:membrane protein DedA with SNARE-associated domain